VILGRWPRCVERHSGSTRREKLLDEIANIRLVRRFLVRLFLPDVVSPFHVRKPHSSRLGWKLFAQLREHDVFCTRETFQAVEDDSVVLLFPGVPNQLCR
jgi:hypothetical protein